MTNMKANNDFAIPFKGICNDDDTPTLLDEQKPPEIYSHLTMTENPFGESIWDHYQKIKKIDEGGTGEIWTVRKKNIDDKQKNDTERHPRIYVAKAIDKNFLFGGFMKELRNEIEVLRTIDHPNVIRILELFETRDMMYLIMEHCSGGNLWSRSDYTEEDVANIMIQILSAVSLCHKQKVVHRDIKFENILFTSKEKDSPVRLVDFGLSQRYRRPRGQYTMKLQVGTTYSIAPEVIEGEYTEKADIWSCGVVAYMLLSGGKMPLDAETKQEIPEVVRKGEYSMEGPEWENVSSEAKSFVSSLMVFDEAERPIAEECMQHPWLNKCSTHGDLPPKEMMEKVKEAIMHVEEDPQLKRLAKMAIAHLCPAEKLERLRVVFGAIDQSHDGTIARDEFAAALHGFGYSEGNLVDLFSDLDQSETGVINYTEFLSATMEAEGEIEEKLLVEAFNKLDIDNCGSISTEGLSEIMDSKNLPESGEEIAAEMLAEVDADDSGKNMGSAQFGSTCSGFLCSKPWACRQPQTLTV